MTTPATPPRVPDNPQPNRLPAKDCLEIAEKVRTGEYFREARSMYDLGIHDPMAERYLYLFITAIALFILIIALAAVQGLYPLNREVPLIFYSNDIVEDIPHIQTLMRGQGDNPGDALLRFMAMQYVVVREEYDISTFDRDANGVKSQSSDAVYKEFQEQIDPHNPDSPITLYQRHTKRKIAILSAKRLPDSLDVIFEAVLESKTEVKKSHWRANISFQYSGIELDEKGEKVKPVKFVVTKYHVKRLQDVK